MSEAGVSKVHRNFFDDLATTTTDGLMVRKLNYEPPKCSHSSSALPN